MARGRFSSSGVTVGTTPQSRYEQRLQHQKSSKVTMGHGLPRQDEGIVGDITVREIATQGLRCYIKTDSGWYDINTMSGAIRTEWIPMVLESSWVRHSTTYSEPAYFRDERGFVHLRGGIKDGSGITVDITTLPTGFRPAHTTIVAAARSAAQESVKILSTGEVNIANGGNTSLSFLDGVSFYAAQKVIGSGGGSGGDGGGGGGGSHGGGGA